MTSVSIVIIEKGGNVKGLKVKSYGENELYKKCGFKSPTDFKQQSVWKNIKLNSISYLTKEEVFKLKKIHSMIFTIIRMFCLLRKTLKTLMNLFFVAITYIQH